jgi:hypothetical protein
MRVNVDGLDTLAPHRNGQTCRRRLRMRGKVQTTAVEDQVGQRACLLEQIPGYRHGAPLRRFIGRTLIQLAKPMVQARAPH